MVYKKKNDGSFVVYDLYEALSLFKGEIIIGAGFKGDLREYFEI